MTKQKQNLLIDLVFLFVSIVFAIWLGNSKEFESFLVTLKNYKFIGAVIAGIFFTSIFTAAPSVVIISELAKNSVWETALFGAIGALAGDLVMFKLMRDRLAKDFYALFHINMDQRYFRIPRFRWLIYLIGGFIIASPFPDELGLAILGFSNMKTSWVIPVSYLFNFLGILAIGFIATL